MSLFSTKDNGRNPKTSPNYLHRMLACDSGPRLPLVNSLQPGRSSLFPHWFSLSSVCLRGSAKGWRYRPPPSPWAALVESPLLPFGGSCFVPTAGNRSPGWDPATSAWEPPVRRAVLFCVDTGLSPSACSYALTLCSAFQIHQGCFGDISMALCTHHSS